ncbi:MAG: hypothetical protein RL226_1922 [Bacteroidota bacterium]
MFQGHWNKQSGPDFLESRIRIEREVWVGSTEIHVRSSDWKKHKHTGDPAYANVILHVVYVDDDPLINEAGQQVPTLELKDLIDASHLEEYYTFIRSEKKLLCSSGLASIGTLSMQSWFNRMAIERLEERHRFIMTLLHERNGDWNAVWWILLCRAIGFGINQQGFEMMGRNINWKHADRWRLNTTRLEALLAGVSGWFNLEDESVPESVRQEFNQLRTMHRYVRVNPAVWQRGKMMPANRPEIRMGQLLVIIQEGWLNWDKLLAVEQTKTLRTSWKKRIPALLLGSKSEGLTVPPGDKAIDLIMTNALIPLMFSYSKVNALETLSDRAICWLELIPAEDNHIIRTWLEAGFKPANVLESQGIIHLHRHYCCQKKCLSCLIGITLLKERVR